MQAKRSIHSAHAGRSGSLPELSRIPRLHLWILHFPSKLSATPLFRLYHAGYSYHYSPTVKTLSKWPFIAMVTPSKTLRLVSQSLRPELHSRMEMTACASRRRWLKPSATISAWSIPNSVRNLSAAHDFAGEHRYRQSQLSTIKLIEARRALKVHRHPR